MVRLIEHKRITAACIILILIVSTIVAIILPKKTTEIKTDTVYMSGYYTEYPDKDDPRYYIEFKKDGTYVLMHDDSRRKQEDYFEDWYWSYPEIEYLSGSYEIKNGNYVLTMVDIAGVEFKDAKAVKHKKIHRYSHKNYKDGKKIKLMVILTKKGNYLMGYPDDTGKSYDERARYYWLYNKSDIKKLPNFVEEFRKQFKMDKKAEQERLAEEARLAEQSQ